MAVASPPRSPANYLVGLKPVVDRAMATRAAWLRFLRDISEEGDLKGVQAQVKETAVRARDQLNESRRLLQQLRAPAPYREMERALDGWIEALAASCDAIASHPGPIGPPQIANAKRKLRDAAVAATKFNAERASVITLGPQAEPEQQAGPRMRMSPKLLAMVLIPLLLLGGIGYWLFAGGSGTTATPTPGATGPTERRVFTQQQVLDRLKQEIDTRKVAFINPDVRLVAPDKIVVTGQVQGPTGPVGVEAELQMAVTPDGKPRVSPTRLAALGVEVPQGAFDALNRRTDEANLELTKQLPQNELLRKVYVENNTVVVEVEVVPGGPPAKPGAEAAKPGAEPAKPAEQAPPAKP